MQNVAPTVEAGPDQTVNEGDTVSFSGSYTDPGSNDTHTIFWDFGDGSNASGTLTPTHVYTDSGVYTVTLKVTDDDDGFGTDALDVTVLPVPVHDVAVANVTASPTDVVVGDIVYIDVVVANEGTETEIFNLYVYADTDIAIIGDEIVVATALGASLNAGANATLSFRWNTTGVVENTYTVSAEVPPVEGEEDTADNTFIDGTVTVTEVVPMLGAIAGTVTDALTGNPIESASVTANGYFDITDAEGLYNITDLPVGTYNVTASATGYYSDTTEVTVTADATVTVNFALEPILVFGWINGTVTDADSMLPIAGASITAGGYSTTTDEFGYYEIEVEPGTYTVTAEADGYHTESVLDVAVTAGKTTTIDIELAPIVPPVASFTYVPTSPLVDETVTFNASASYDPDGTIVSYEWDFGDGTNATGVIATHVYTNAGTYTVVLTVTDSDGLNDTTSHPITIGKLASSISISVSPTTVKLGESTTISGSIAPARVGVAVTISYRLSGEAWNTLAARVTDENSQYSYDWAPETVGTYEVKASWEGDANTLADESDIVTVVVTLLYPPVASFVYEPLTPYVGDTVTFNASASYDPDGTIISYEWVFGDGNTGTGNVTTHIYADNGTYTVTLTVTDNDGLIDTTSDSVTVLNRPPVAIFTESAETVYTGVAITFNASDSYDPDGSITNYSWDFGDGHGAWGMVIIVDHAYADNGAYTVTLTVADNDGATDSVNATKTVLNRPPVASFVENATTVLTDEVIRFDATSSSDPDGSIVSYSWDFGDGTRATGVIVEHAYEDDGTYTVTLTVTDDDEASDSASAIKTVLNRPPVASFTWSPLVPSVNETVTFDASASYDSDGTIVSYEWDFGDGTNATGVIATHVYTNAGTYTVVLTVTDDGTPLLSGISSADITVSLLPVHDLAVVSVVPSTYEVFVGDSVLIQVTVVNKGNQPESFSVKAYADTSLIGSTSGSLGLGENQTYIISWVTTTSGSFLIKGEVPPVGDETETADNVLEDGTVDVLPIPTPPVAAFTEDPETPRVDETVIFDASSSYDPDGYIVAWNWDFGDGNSASGEVVSHTYMVAGDYNVTLRVIDNDGLADIAWHIKTVLPVATGTLTVTTTPVSGEVFVNGTSWGLAPQSRVALVGTYNVSFGDVAGYYTPDWRLATVSENVETVVEGVYRPITVALNATVDLDPDTLNLKSEGKWITCYIRLPEGYDVGDIDVSTILIDGVVPAEWGNVEGNVLMVKFDRQAVIEYIRDVLEIADGEVTLTVTGKLYDETMFEGSDTIRVISRGRREELS